MIPQTGPSPQAHQHIRFGPRPCYATCLVCGGSLTFQWPVRMGLFLDGIRDFRRRHTHCPPLTVDDLAQHAHWVIDPARTPPEVRI